MSATAEIHVAAAKPRSLVNATALAMVAAAAEIGGSFFVGWLTARQLGADGKGEYTAITTWVLVTAWVVSIGLRDSVAFFQSRRPQHAGTIFSTSMIYTLLLGTVGVLVAQLLAPIAFRAQSDEMIDIARIAMFGILLIVVFQTVEGILAGQHRFVFLSSIQAVASIGAAVIMGAYVVFDELTVESALLGKVGIYVLCTALPLVVILRHLRPTRPSAPLGREMMGYGSKLTFEGLGQLGTTQLDLVVLPAVLTATEIGHYSVAVSIGTMIYLVFGRLRQIVLPVAARHEQAEAVEFTARVTRLVLLGAAVCAIGLAVIAKPLFVTVYGSDFEESVTPLLVLLPGSVAWSGYCIVASGLQGLNRPGQTSRAQLIATAITLVGLALTLGPMGIIGAALTSTIAYVCAFFACMRYLAKVGDVGVFSMLSPRLFVADVTSAWGSVRRRAALR